MNDESINAKKRITKFPICQFYIVLGRHDREFRSNKENKFFPIRGNEDVKLIQYAVTEEYKKKKKEGYAVASEIIFLVPDVKYKDLAFKLMEILNFNGRVKVVPPLKKEETPKVVSPKPVEKVVEKVAPIEEEKAIVTNKVLDNEVEKEEPKEKVVENKVHEEKKVVPPKPVKKMEDTTDVGKYMWGDTKLENTKVKTKSRVRKKEPEKISFDSPKKSAAFIDLPVIVFILSALLLIGSVVLLFIWK